MQSPERTGWTGAEPIREADRSTSDLCVLVVDDDTEVLRLMERLLRGVGLSVIAERDPLDAARAYRNSASRVAALVTDLDLPRLSGVELAALLAEVHPALPVLIVSGAFSRYPDSLQEIERRGWKWLSKPFAPAALVSAVRAAVAFRSTDTSQQLH